MNRERINKEKSGDDGSAGSDKVGEGVSRLHPHLGQVEWIAFSQNESSDTKLPLNSYVPECYPLSFFLSRGQGSSDILN